MSGLVTVNMLKGVKNISFSCNVSTLFFCIVCAGFNTNYGCSKSKHFFPFKIVYIFHLQFWFH